MKSRFMLSCAAAAVALGSGELALAQSAPQADAAASTSSDVIIVTAQRRDQSIQDVPLTLQAFSTDTLSKLNVTSIDGLLKYTPNVTFSNNGPGQGAIFLRGLSAGFAGQQSSATIGGFPNVAVYLDDQSMQFPARNVDIYVADIERVEVLEGPQGTLFGGGAQAGVLRYITNKPKYNKFEGRLEGSFGGTAQGAANGSFNAMFNIPVIEDKLAIRAVVYADHHGGYIDNKFSTFTRRPSDLGSYYLAYQGNGNQLTPDQQVRQGKYDNNSLVEDNFNPVDYTGGRVAVGWKIAPDWDLLVTEAYQKLESKGTFAAQSYTYDYQPLTGLSSTLFAPQYNKDDYTNTAWTLNGKLGDFKVIYTGAYLTRHISQQGDYTNYARSTYGIFYQCTGGANYYWNVGKAPYCYEPTSYWTDKVRNTHESHEFRISTPDSGRIRAIAGAYYENFKIQDNQDWDYKTIPSCDPSLTADQIKNAGTVCMGLVAPNPNATLNVQGPRGPYVAFGEDTQRGFKQYAQFLSVDFDILPNLTITGGTRHYYYKEYETGSVYSSFNGGCYQVPVCATGSNLDAQNLQAHYSGFKSKATITWKPSPGTMLYATWSQGFRPGAFNRGSSARVKDPLPPHAPQLLVSAAYAPDNLTNWEGGLKTDLFDRKVTFNLSAYYMSWDNIQIGFFNPAAGFGNTAFAVNGPTYHIKGAEVQIVARPAAGLTFQGSATYNDSKQANSPCFIANNPGVSSFGKCITQVFSGGAVKDVQSPFGTPGSITPFSPHFQGNIRGRYEWTGKGGVEWFVAGGVNYTSSYFNQPGTYPSGDEAGNGNGVGPNGIIVPGTTVLRYKMKGYALADAQVGFTRDNWTVTLFGDNIFNSHASTFTNSSQFIKTSTVVRPLTYGIKIATKL
ncbi:TonB-dependent receptor [Novosphingobium fuchskuhlense]|uniref:TonB-dependent receptor n=1 Tax=Novosphingobium fuchskuhlense TaxID=1117702 RepID=UPI0012E3F953|nr:TonB-dependent receptor [Novosphingobium fuchskuhlense]